MKILRLVLIPIIITLLCSCVSAQQTTQSNKQIHDLVFSETPISFEWYIKQDENRFKSPQEDGQIDVIGMVCFHPEGKKCSEIVFMIEVFYIRADEDYAKVLHFFDGTHFIPHLYSKRDNKQHIFEVPMFQWIHYMRHGLNGILVFENSNAITVDVPAKVFKDIDAAFESWKKE